MKIDEYIRLSELDNMVCCDIDRRISGEEMETYNNTDTLLKSAEDVICEYRKLVYSLLKNIDIEDYIMGVRGD